LLMIIARHNTPSILYFFHDTAPTEIYTLSLHDALPILQPPRDNSTIRPVPRAANRHDSFVELAKKGDIDLLLVGDSITDLWRNRSEEHTSELQSLRHLVCRLLLEKKKQINT